MGSVGYVKGVPGVRARQERKGDATEEVEEGIVEVEEEEEELRGVWGRPRAGPGVEKSASAEEDWESGVAGDEETEDEMFR